VDDDDDDDDDNDDDDDESIVGSESSSLVGQDARGGRVIVEDGNDLEDSKRVKVAARATRDSLI
jgi:hypothetical protein